MREDCTYRSRCCWWAPPRRGPPGSWQCPASGWCQRDTGTCSGRRTRLRSGSLRRERERSEGVLISSVESVEAPRNDMTAVENTWTETRHHRLWLQPLIFFPPCCCSGSQIPSLLRGELPKSIMPYSSHNAKSHTFKASLIRHSSCYEAVISYLIKVVLGGLKKKKNPHC